MPQGPSYGKQGGDCKIGTLLLTLGIYIWYSKAGTELDACPARSIFDVQM